MVRLRAARGLLFVTAAYAVALLLLRRVVGVSLTSPWFVLTAMICFLGWVASARPLFLPRLPRWLRPVHAWELDGHVFRAVGVPAFGSLLRRTPLRFLNVDVYLGRQRGDLASVSAQLEAAEASHLWDTILVVPYMVYAGVQGWMGVVMWFTVAQLVVNVYPILHLRRARGRLTRLLDRQTRGRALQTLVFLTGNRAGRPRDEGADVHGRP